jgi:lantibiotic modifying enzyme
LEADYRDVGEAAWSWVLSQVRGDQGPWLPDTVPGDQPPSGPAADRDSLYAGIAGLAPVLAEIAQSRALNNTEQRLATAIVARLAAQALTRTEASLYDGLAGDATALAMLAPGTEAAPMQRVASLMTPAGWPTTLGQDGSDAPLTDIIAGSAGIVLAATWAGGEHAEEIAAGGGEALLSAADRTEAGLDWGAVPGAPSRGPNYSHGTAGVATALAVAGALLDRADFVEASVQGAQHLLAVGSLDDGGFIVPHTIPPTTSRVVEPVTYTWCHGPTGTSHLFSALAHAGVSEVTGLEVTDLRRRCLHSVLTSGVPQRLRPGFWDNDGRCCGTAGVGDVLLDAAQDSPDPDRRDMLMAAARTMGDALVERVIRDEDGARWRFIEHRQDPPLLPPGTSWMQGAAGIATFLLRLARVLGDGPDAPVVDRPDQWWAVPARLRTVRPPSAVPEQGS